MNAHKITSERSGNIWWSRPDMPPVGDWWYHKPTEAEIERLMFGPKPE